jgi:hypothetical protein
MTAAGDSDMFLIDKPDGHQIVHSCNHVVDLATPRVLDIGVTEVFAIASATAKVRFKYDVTLVRKENRPLRSAERDLALGASVGKNDRRIAGARL